MDGERAVQLGQKKTRTFFVYTNEAQTGLSQVSSYWVILHWDSCVNKDFYFVNLRNIFHLEKSEKVNKYHSSLKNIASHVFSARY